MENFSLSGASGWQTLSSLLIAAGYKGTMLWSVLIFRNTSANTIILKEWRGVETGPSTDSGINLTATGGAADGISIDAGNQGAIDGNKLWIKCSSGPTTFDFTAIRKMGVS